ncbi:MAG: zinc ribbon domain-containing protein [Hyphomicrobiales bacterium]|nr:zinc ribbon domain-containing protein [Hyphomicrobiales bacterium]
MPLYAYRCEDCEKTFETLARSSEEPACPHCNGVRLERQLSLIAQPARGGDSGDAGACDGAGGCGMCPAMAGAACG